MTVANWDLKLAETDVLNMLGVPRRVRRDPKRRAEVVRVLQPPSLMRSRDSILQQLDGEMLERSSAVFFYVPPGSDEPNAVAETLGRCSRAVAVTQGLMPLMSMTTALVQVLMLRVQAAAGEVLRRSPKQILPPDQALRLLSTLAADISPTIELDDWTVRAVGILAASRDDPSALKEFSEAQPPFGVEPLAGLILRGGVRFVLGHELAHLLLGHGRKRFGPPWEGGREKLLSELELLGLSWDDGRVDASHRDEFEADALGFFLTSRTESNDEESSYWASVESVAGAYAALLCLSLMEEGSDREEGTPDSHPSFRERCLRIGEIAIPWSAPSPYPPVLSRVLERKVHGDAHAIGMVLWLVVAVVEALVVAEQTRQRDTGS